MVQFTDKRWGASVLLLLFLSTAHGSKLPPKAQQPSSCTERPRMQNFNSIGAWFDDVAKLNCNSVSKAPNASVAIIGGGVSGLTTALMLDSIGLHNWEIIEASDRVGGRFRTKFVGGTQEFAEMGPMRLPYTVTYKSDDSTHEYTEHRLTFQLAETLNEMNGNDSKWKVDFIPWIQHHPNELIAWGTGRHPDGRIPTRCELKPRETASYGINRIQRNKAPHERDPQERNYAQGHPSRCLALSQCMMREAFHASENITDAIWTATDYDVFWDEMVHNSNLALDGTKDSLGETEWKCVDGGFNRLTDAFIPHVSDRLVLNRKIRKLESVKGEDGQAQTRLSWYPSVKNRTFESKDYDYTIMAVPFTMTRFMALPSFSSVLGRAISEAGLRFKSACKVSLLFSERFWEKGERPIFGGYSIPESRPIGALYYPVYGLNESRPGLITHYRGGDWSDRYVSFSDEEHVQTVLDAIVSLHGEQARELYTGDYERLCWLKDEHTATSWCRPDVEQHNLYIPAYHQTEHNTIFIGEHTAPTQAWISSAIYSAARGTIQLLLELGMVEEAKEINRRWMGRWIRDETKP
ncbi:L-amino-acid oxidase [Fusarium oxysporum f. sp. conglutinans]|nr:L-amino-acid oxidase [Fusarium oxysporum f. sp. conglutinans]